MRLVPILLSSLLAACAAESTVPTDNVTDYEVTFLKASASDSCGADLKAEANAEEARWKEDEYTVIYRFYRLSEDTDGDGEANELTNEVEVYWREQFTNEEDFVWFGQGMLEGDMDTGVFTYGARSFREERGDNTVYYDIEGRAAVRLSDQLRHGVEDYIIVPPTNDAPQDFEVGCVYSLEYEGTQVVDDAPAPDPED